MTDKDASNLIKKIEQDISFHAALVVAREYIHLRHGMSDFNESSFIESLAPHLLPHHLTGECSNDLNS